MSITNLVPPSATLAVNERLRRLCRASRWRSSLLYGQTDDQRRQALAAENPAELPWIKGSLDRLGDAVAALQTERAASPDVA